MAGVEGENENEKWCIDTIVSGVGEQMGWQTGDA